jgi:hypothetical protein
MANPVQLRVTASFERLVTLIGLDLRVEHRHLRTIAMIVLSPDDPPSGRPVLLHVAMVDHAALSTAARRCRRQPDLRGYRAGPVRDWRAEFGGAVRGAPAERDWVRRCRVPRDRAAERSPVVCS